MTQRRGPVGGLRRFVSWGRGFPREGRAPLAVAREESHPATLARLGSGDALHLRRRLSLILHSPAGDEQRHLMPVAQFAMARILHFLVRCLAGERSDGQRGKRC